MKWFKKLSDGLECMEPLFRLIEVIFLVFGTTFVSCQANTIAQQANKIAEIQLDVSKEEMQPNFIIDQALEPNTHGIENANAVLYIYNTGANFSNLDVDTACIIEMNYIDGNNNLAKQSFSLKDFYWMSRLTANTEGLLCTMYHEDNWQKYIKLYKDVLYDTQIHAGYIDFFQYVKISYKDIYGEKHTKYYLINEIRQQLITEERGEEAFCQYNENSNTLYVDTLSLDELLQSVS